MRIQLMPAEGSLVAHVKMLIVNRTDHPSDTIPFLLYRLFKVDSVGSETGERLFFKQNVQMFSDTENLQLNAVRVSLRRPLDPGDSVIVSLAYHGVLLGYPEIMAYVQDKIDSSFTLLRPDAFAYPMLAWPTHESLSAAYAEKFTYDLSVVVPPGFVVACGGTLLGRGGNGTEAGVWREFHYVSKVPTWRMDIAAARFTTIRDSASELFIYVLPGDEQGANTVLRSMKNVIRFYNSYFGPLEDYRGYTAIEIPDDWGSQASDYYFLQTAAAFRDTMKMGEVYHEIAHMWNVPSEGLTKRCRYFDEAFAMYFQALSEKEFHGSVAFNAAMERSRLSFIRRVKSDSVNANTPIADYGRLELGSNSYSKGPWSLYVLNQIVGDSVFREIMREMRRKFSTSPVTFQRFKELAGQVSGRMLTRFFDEWIFGVESSRLMTEGFDIGEIVKRY